MRTRLLAATAILFIGACTVTDRAPLVDLQGGNTASYEADLQECQDLTNGVDSEQEVIMKSVLGAITWGALGAVFGNSDITGSFIGAGAVSGAAHGSVNSIETRNEVMRRCLEGRGYRVLN